MGPMSDLSAEPAVDLDAAADRLYGLDLGEFTTHRKALAAAARRTGDGDLSRQIEGLRAPTLAAWALNQLVRARPEQVDALRRTGERLRTAQAGLDATELRALRPQRDHLLVAFVSAAASVAAARGQALSPAVQSEVRNTLVVALADERAQEAVLSGQLVKALLYAGLGEVPIGAVAAVRDGDEAVRDTSSASSRSESQGLASRPLESQRSAGTGRPERQADLGLTRRARREEARRREEAEAASRRAATARDGVQAADRALAAASLAEAEARRLVDSARNRIREFEDLLASARADHDSLEAEAQHATRERVDAAAALERAQAELAALEDDGARG